MSYKDNLSQFARTEDDTNKKYIENKAFEKQNSLKFKITKFKVMRRLKEEMKIYLNEKILELIYDHTYLPIIVLYNGESCRDE